MGRAESPGAGRWQWPPGDVGTPVLMKGRRVEGAGESRPCPRHSCNQSEVDFERSQERRLLFPSMSTHVDHQQLPTTPSLASGHQHHVLVVCLGGDQGVPSSDCPPLQPWHPADLPRPLVSCRPFLPPDCGDSVVVEGDPTGLVIRVGLLSLGAHSVTLGLSELIPCHGENPPF